VRGADGEDLAVVVFDALHAERRSRLRGRRPRRVPPGAVEPEPVPITRATVISADAFATEAAAHEWLESCRASGDHAGEEITTAIGHVNLAVGAYRVCAADPYAGDVSREQALQVRLGYGGGSELVDGDWADAYAMPGLHGVSRRERRRMLTPEQELAGILTGRRPPAYPSEELLLRARLDLDHGRVVEAALQARVATDALAVELAGGESELPEKHADAAKRLAKRALSEDLGDEEVGQLTELIVTLERAVRRRRYADRD
jgi:hypothetical protein